MNPDTNRFETLTRAETKSLGITTTTVQEQLESTTGALVRPDGSPVPKHWATFAIGEHVTVKDYTFKVAYIGESTILLEPVGTLIRQGKTKKRRRVKR